MNLLKAHKTFGGETRFYEHDSSVTKTKMRFSCFVPGKQSPERALIWLSGLTCNEENFITKAGAQRLLADTAMMVICPDTSPRGLDLPGEHESYDFGSGAGFYLNATTEGYREHYRMEDYLMRELLPLVREQFKLSSLALSGHSMGGHGALTLGLKHPGEFSSISAFSPIVNPTNCPWGQKAFEGYLGADRTTWLAHDACELVLRGSRHSKKILIDQGRADEFLEGQLKPELFKKACQQAGQPLELRYQEGYDHSYYFIQSFLEDHIHFHLNS